MDWSDLKEKIKNEERAFVVGMGVLIFLAAVIELLVQTHNLIIPVSDYDSVSLVIIQIQATVQTLSIALLALVSGRISESYMGINYNDFQFNIRPSVFTQKRIIYGLIALLVSNVFFHMLGLYNMVVAVFLAVCILIIISVKEIYAVFVDGMSTEKEIEAYLKSFTTEAEMPDEKMINAFQILCRGWRKDSDKQSILEYEQYQEVFNCFLDVLLLSEAPNAQLIMEQEASGLVKHFSKSRNLTVKEKGLRFLNEFYEQSCRILTHNTEQAKKIKQGIHVLRQAYYELAEAIPELNIKTIEKTISLTNFVEQVVLCNFWLGYNPEKCYELSSLSDFILILGRQLKTDSSYNIGYWGAFLEYLDGRIEPLPDQCVSEANAIICDIKLRYAILLIRMGQIKILKDFYYDKAVKFIELLQTTNGAKLFLKIQCYFFYLAYYENLNCISVELKEMTEKLLMDTKLYFCHGTRWIERYEEKNPGSIFNESLIHEILFALRPFECYPKNGDAKILVMPDVVNDFVVFLAMYLSNRYYHPALLMNIISTENEIFFYMRYFQDTATIDRFSKFLQIVDCKKKPQILLNEFRRILKERIKKTQIEQAHEEYASSEKEEQSSYDNLSQKILEYLKEKFEPILSQDAKKVNRIKFPVLRIGAISDMSIESIVNGQYDVIAQQLIKQLCYILKSTDSVHVIKRKSFADDETFFAFLSSEEKSIILGSEFSISPSDYSNRDKLDEVLASKKCVLEGYTDYALLLEEGSLQIFIQDVNIRTHSGTLEDEEFEYDANTGLYSYEVTKGIPIEFTEQELVKYVHDKRKIVDIVLSISLKKKQGKIGTLLLTDGAQ